MANLNDLHDQEIVFDRVQDAVIPLPQAIGFLAGKFTEPGPRIVLKSFYSF
jgi:hypothetical protein